MKDIWKKNLLLWIVIIIPYISLILIYFGYKSYLNDVKDSSFVLISKQEMMLYQYNFKGDLLQKSPIACGKNFGNKSKIGDYKTPEGVFLLGTIQDASKWTHDFPDDSLGEISGAYGPYFINILVPNQKGIGIHGTHDSSSIGTRASEGCIRMPNDELVMLVKHLKSSSVVVITPSQTDLDSTVALAIKPVLEKKIKKLLQKGHPSNE